MRDYDLEIWAIGEPKTIRDLVAAIDRSGKGTVFVTDASGVLLASVTDGDIRRALLGGSGLESSAEAAFHTNFVSLKEGSDLPEKTWWSEGREFTEYPVVDDEGKLVCVEFSSSRPADKARNNTVVIMAGGKGLRLRPLTEQTPKPLLPVGGKPVLQHIVENLRDEGFSDIVIAVNYLGSQIEAHFGDGSGFGVRVRYLRENQPLGTAGALSLLEAPLSSPFVVMNADLVVSARIGKLVDYHVSENADMTVGAKMIETTVPFGVLVTRGDRIEAIEEKPSRTDLVNAGVYVINEELLGELGSASPTDMPELIAWNLDDRRVLAFPLHEDWLDLGRPDDLRKARAEVKED